MPEKVIVPPDGEILCDGNDDRYHGWFFVLNGYLAFDMRMSLVILQNEIRKWKIKNVMDFRIDDHFW